MHLVAAVLATGVFAFQQSRNFVHSSNRRFWVARKPLLKVQVGDQLFVDDSGQSWQALSESGGFCNQIYVDVNNFQRGLNNEQKELKILKVYSELARKRMKLSGNQDFDEAMGDLGIGPMVLKSTENYVIMEKLNGKVLSNEDIMIPTSFQLQSVARTLANLHCVKLFNENEGEKNMLWLCCDTLLEQLEELDDELYRMYSSELRQQQLVLEDLRLPIVLGHGDFKPSNVIILDCSGDAKLIDWETCGRHYRAYDLAKFFRGVETHTEEEDQLLSRIRLAFIKSYCDAVGATLGEKVDAPSCVSLESKLLLPMTWLEAALFFHCKSYDGGSTTDMFTDYAQQRLVSYQKSLAQWEIDINEYRSLLCD